MDMTIDNEWNMLYSHNPKIQAFAILKNGEIIWQTSNWDCVPAAAALTDAPASARESVEIGGVKYKRVTSTQESYIATADKDQGHLLMSRVEVGIWLIAWATHDSIPDLTLIDLSKTAVQFMRRL
ncbi:MAG: hypothetical protein ACFFEU_02445 [Candidatus Thorarchaeota archaeon]|jgi:hypothetical protein